MHAPAELAHKVHGMHTPHHPQEKPVIWPSNTYGHDIRPIHASRPTLENLEDLPQL